MTHGKLGNTAVRGWKPPIEGWEAARHPESPYPVDVGDTTADTAGHALLDLRIGCVKAFYAPDRTPAPQAPVVLVDGRPAVQGWGRARVHLPAGAHLVEVQAGRSRVCRLIDVTGTVALDYLHLLPRHWAGERYDTMYAHELDQAVLGPRGAVKPPSVARWTGGLWAWLAFALATAALAPVALRLGDNATAPMWGAVAIAGTIALAVRAVLRRSPAYAGQLAFPPSHADHIAPGLVLLSPHDTATPRPPDGLGGIRLKARFTVAVDGPRAQRAKEGGDSFGERVRRAKAVDTIGEPEPLPHRPWVPGLSLTVDGQVVELGWGDWFLPLAPGEHAVTAATPPPPPTLTAHEEADTAASTARWDLAVTAGAVTELDYDVLVAMPTGADGTLERFTATTAAPLARADREDGR